VSTEAGAKVCNSVRRARSAAAFSRGLATTAGKRVAVPSVVHDRRLLITARREATVGRAR